MIAAPADIDLPRVMAFLVAAQEAACIANAYARPPASPETALKHIAAAQEAVESAMRRLQSAGVEIPTNTPRTKPADAFSLASLSSLASLDTADARALLSGLSDLLPLAERLDRERGHWYENAPESDTKGTDLAEAVHSLICRLELELSGPRSHRGE